LVKVLEHANESAEGCAELYEPKNECFICRKKFIFNRMKKHHIRTEHKDACVHNECPHCKSIQRRFKDPLIYENHLRTHLTPPDHVCSFCGKGFYRWESWWLHKQEQHGEIVWRYCDLCDYKGKSKALLSTHMKKHSSELHPVCDICSKTVRCIDNHIFSVHKTAELGCYYCRSCDFCFAHRFQFKLHVPRCNGPTGKKYPSDSLRIPRSELDPNCRVIEES
jgi:hypothetical protein